MTKQDKDLIIRAWDYCRNEKGYTTGDTIKALALSVQEYDLLIDYLL